MDTHRKILYRLLKLEDVYKRQVDNRTAMENVSRFANNSGYNVEVKSDGGIYHLMLNLK